MLNDPGEKNKTGKWIETLRARRVFIETYGCRFNFGDSAKLVEVLKTIGSEVVDSAEEADAIIVNTCTVVGPTERKMLRRLSSFRDRDLYVTGCMPAVQSDAILAVCSPTIIPPAEIRDAYISIGTVVGDGAGIVQIAQGCSGRCTYCITRAARGPLKSNKLSEVLSQIDEFVRAGSPEIQLTAQDVSAWGIETGNTLPELLTSIGSHAGNSMLRVGMMNPRTILGILDELVDSFAHASIFKFIHIPVQSGSDRILERMGRGYTSTDFEKMVKKFRARYPTMTIATDLIVGFPGETVEDFALSCELIDRIRPNKVNVTRYSRRPSTPVYAEPDFPDFIKKERSRTLNLSAEKIYQSINKEYLGMIVPFIVTETIKEGSVMARTPDYQGVVIKENLPLGCRGNVVLKKDRKYFFLGERVK